MENVDGVTGVASEAAWEGFVRQEMEIESVVRQEEMEGVERQEAEGVVRQVMEAEGLIRQEAEIEAVPVGLELPPSPSPPLPSLLQAPPTQQQHTIPEVEFVWEEYLEETETEAVPPTAFLHVEKSLESGVLEDQLVEVIHCGPDPSSPPTGYWLATVITTCGPLFRLRYVTGSSATSMEIWREAIRGGLRPLGWSKSHNVPLSVPTELAETLGEAEAEARIAVETAETEGVGVPEEALEVEGYTAVDRIKQGMKLEVLLGGEDLSGWVATVMENVGGRLLLRYDTPNCSGDTFWLFYTHHRLRPPDWIQQHANVWKYQPPSTCVGYEEAEWGALLEMSRADALHSPLPSALLTPAPSLHSPPQPLHAGLRVEAVHPFKPQVMCVAFVAEILDEQYVRLELDDKTEERVVWVTTFNDPTLLPPGFCKENNLPLVPPKNWESEAEFDWDSYTSYSPCPLATKDMFPDFELSEELDFLPGMKLEAVNPLSPNQLCAASVKRTCGHLVVIQLDSEPDAEQVIRAGESQDLFPTGWAQANNYPLQLPAQYCPRSKTEGTLAVAESQEKTEEGTAGSSDGGGNGKERSMWCPRLYINHWCYSGPYLSKSKVAKQSQGVGPGSVELVLREVVAATINAAYIPTRVLRELQRNAPDLAATPSSWRPTPFKAKFKRYNYAANIALATTASDVSDFLYAICGTLQCCPNLWSAIPSGENCPLLCTAQMVGTGSQSTGWRGRGRVSMNRGMRGFSGSARIIHRRKRGGRKRLFVPVKANRLLQTKTLTASGEDVLDDIEDDDEGELEEVCEDDDVVSGSDEGDTSSRSSRPTSPCMDRRRKNFPGIKYPEDAAQMKARQGKKRFELGDPAGATGYQDPMMKRSRKNDFPDNTCGLEPARVASDPADWTVQDVEQYVTSQPAICHHAVQLREQEVDGRAFLLLNLPTLVQHLGLPHSSAVALAQHICRVKLAHFLFFYRNETPSHKGENWQIPGYLRTERTG